MNFHPERLCYLTVGLLLLVAFEADSARVVGGDGVVFNFVGQKNTDFCLVTDPEIHVNAHVIGSIKSRRLTWINGLAIMTHKLNLFVGAQAEKKWDVFLDHLEIKLNGKELFIPAPGHKAGPTAEPGVFESAEYGVTITRQRVNEAHIEILGLLDVIVTVDAAEAETGAGSICSAHLNLEIRRLSGSSSIHGVLGQTFRPQRLQAARLMSSKNLEESVAMDMAALGRLKGPAIAGRASDYMASGLWAPDCHFSKFVPKRGANGMLSGHVIGLEIASKGKAGRHEEEGKVSPVAEEVNPLEAYFSEDAVRAVRRSKVSNSEAEDMATLQRLEESREGATEQQEEEGIVVAFSLQDFGPGISHADSEASSDMELNESIMSE